MNLTAIFLISAVILTAAIAFAIVIDTGKYKRGRVLTPFNVVFGGVFLAAFVCLLPIYDIVLSDASSGGLKTITFTLYNTFKIFTFNADNEVVLKVINGSNNSLAAIFSSYLSVLFVIAPILTVGVVLSFFKNVSAYIRYIFNYFNDAYVFSELNEKSLSLGADIRKNHKRATIVYTSVFSNKDDAKSDLIEQARAINAIFYKKDILAVNFNIHYKKSQVVLYTISDDEGANVDQSLKLIELYKGRENTDLFVFSTKKASELLLAKADKGFIKVRRVNEIRSLVNRILYEQGAEIFKHANEADGENKKISAVIVGLGQHGTEMLKALAWFCQMDGYHVEIDAFDVDEKAEDKFSAIAPDLMSKEYNGVAVPGEIDYTIRIHSGCDVSTKSFADEIAKLTEATYVFVSLGSDDANIKAAADLRMMFERINAKPIIQSIVYSAYDKNALEEVTNYRGQRYDISFVGDRHTIYSEAVIMKSDLEEDALRRHLKWGKEDDFWQYEYNYNSSVASAIHMRARIACGIPGAEKKEADLTDEERDIIQRLEHRRWNAYMRSEGYIYSKSRDKSSRNDLAKMHNDLVNFSLLNEQDAKKDSSVGTV